MEDIPQIYQMETVEQLRAVSDRLRVRIFEALVHRPMTVAQLSEQFGLAHARVHYHVRELEQVGLVRLVETREKGGILEKYYRSIARDLGVAPALLHSMPPDESVGAIGAFLQEASHGFTRAFARGLLIQSRGEAPSGTTTTSMHAATLFLTREQALELERQIRALIAPFRAPRGGEDEREHTVLHLLYSEPPAGDEDEGGPRARPAAAPGEFDSPLRPAPPAAPPPVRGRLHRALSVGATAYERADLERLAERGERLDVYVLGSCAFADDIPAALVDRVIGRFRLRGRLDATPEVRAVLRRKEKDR